MPKMSKKGTFLQGWLLLALASRVAGIRQFAQETPAQSVQNNARQETAWEILCLSGQAGQFRHWSQHDCSSAGALMKGKQCHQLTVRCDVDKRVETVSITWKVTGDTKTLSIPKMATAVTAEDYYHRFFVVSEGCPHGKADRDCDLPWEAFDEPRVAASKVELARRFLVYDNRIVGKPRIFMETNKYSAVFHESSFKLLGTGIPVPKSAIFAGSTGTDCAPNVQCAVPPLSVKPVLKKELDVTSRFVIESPSDPGHLLLMSNRNTGTVQNTYEVEFALDPKKA
jgi:hypothetical protein